LRATFAKRSAKRAEGGRGLLGLRAGELAEVSSPRGIQRFKLLEVTIREGSDQ
jgi:transcription elongation GreA/GreB family factor